MDEALVAKLEAEKAEAVEAEDYGRAKELKGLIEAAKAGGMGRGGGLMGWWVR